MLARAASPLNTAGFTQHVGSAWVFELLGKAIGQQALFDVVSDLLCLVNMIFETAPSQQKEINVVALQTRFAALALATTSEFV